MLRAHETTSQDVYVFDVYIIKSNETKFKIIIRGIKGAHKIVFSSDPTSVSLTGKVNYLVATILVHLISQLLVYVYINHRKGEVMGGGLLTVSSFPVPSGISLMPLAS